MAANPKETRTALFIVTSFWAVGELLIALELAERLKSYGISPLFLAPPSHEKILKEKKLAYVLLIPKAGNINRIQMKEIQDRHKPGWIVLADHLNYTFCERHYGLTLDDLDVFSGRLGTLDLYDYRKAIGKADTYGFVAKNLNQVPIDRYQFFLQPAPVLAPGQGDQPDAIRYPLFQDVIPRTETHKEKSRNTMGIKKDEKLIIYTTSLWQQRYKPYKNSHHFIQACLKTMEHLFLELLKDENVKIFSIGVRSLFKDGEPANFKHFDQMNPAEFNALRDGADLFLSNNYISTSMAKMVLAGIPTLLLSNSFLKMKQQTGGNGQTWLQKWPARPNLPHPEILTDVETAYPFRMFPVGWYKFLNHVVKDNPYYSLMHREELFDTPRVLDTINRILNQHPETGAQERADYIESLSRMTDLDNDFAVPHPGK